MSDEPAEVVKMLVLSTAHLREKTCNDWLPNCPWTSIEKGDIGWFMHVNWSDDQDNEAYHSADPVTPNELVVILKYAHEHGCEWIMFDRDAEPQPGLVVYEW